MKYYEEIEHIFTPGDCGRLIDIAEKQGLKNGKKYASTTLIDRDLATRLFKQLKDHYPRFYNNSVILGFNDNFRILKYYSGHKVHQDNSNYDSFGNIGVLTLNIFLNDNFIYVLNYGL